MLIICIKNQIEWSDSCSSAKSRSKRFSRRIEAAVTLTLTFSCDVTALQFPSTSQSPSRASSASGHRELTPSPYPSKPSATPFARSSRASEGNLAWPPVAAPTCYECQSSTPSASCRHCHPGHPRCIRQIGCPRTPSHRRPRQTTKDARAPLHNVTAACIRHLWPCAGIVFLPGHVRQPLLTEH